MKILLVIIFSFLLVACTSSTEQKFLAMSESQLAQYNESQPELKQIVCEESVRRGTVGLVRKVCTTKSRMARLATSSRQDSRFNLSDPGLYGTRSFNTDRQPVSRIYFSPPPPGYEQPVIHVLDNRQ